MYQINYHSKAKPGLRIKDLDDILEKAIAVNSTKDVSGCLIYHDNSFVQILEGRKEDVLELYKKIEADQRHHTVTLLWESNVKSRVFTEWNMAFHRPANENVKYFVNNLILLSELSERSTGSLLSFWATVRKILRGGTINQLNKS